MMSSVCISMTTIRNEERLYKKYNDDNHHFLPKLLPFLYVSPLIFVVAVVVVANSMKPVVSLAIMLPSSSRVTMATRSRYRTCTSSSRMRTFLLTSQRSWRSCSSSSSSSNINNENEEQTIESNTTTSTTTSGDVLLPPPSSHYQIVLRRNHQSKTFREGNPLCFSGSILYAAQLLHDGTSSTTTLTTTTTTKKGEEYNYLLPPPSIGSFVSVSVSSSTKSTTLVEDLIQINRQSINNKKRKKKTTTSPSTSDTKQILSTTPYFILNKTSIINSIGSSIKDDSQKELPSTLLYTDATQASTVGYGIYNPHSMYRVRILCHQRSDPLLFQAVQQKLITSTKNSTIHQRQQQQQALQIIIEWKLLAAMKCREAIHLPSNSTDTFRWINGEGDGLSGLCIDIIGKEAVVVMSSAAWVEIYQDTIQHVIRHVLLQQQHIFPTPVEIIWRSTPSRLQQDGYYLRNISSAADDDDDGDDDVNHSVEDGEEEEGEEKENENIEDIVPNQDNEEVNDLTSTPAMHNHNRTKFIIGTESNIKYKISPWSGQKTGFYCDQRDNRLRIASLCKDKHVLDLCCYTGGFALNAIINGGATFALGVDSSQEAIDRAKENAYLHNGLSSTQIQFERADIGLFMKKTFQAKQFYDVVILDPPKLAPSISALDRSSRKYFTLNRDAIQLVNPNKGGLLLSCTCSAAMTQRDGGRFFLQTIQSAAMSAQRHITLLQTHGAAACHTLSPAATYPSGAYLTAALFFVSPIGSPN